MKQIKTLATHTNINQQRCAMNFLKKIILSVLNTISSALNTNSVDNNKSVDNNYSDGCTQCGELSFQHDTYFDDYSCDNCGWTVNKKPTGDIKISEIIPSNNKQDVESGVNLSFDEVGEIIKAYGDSMVNNAPPSTGVADVSMLPYPKETIKAAIHIALEQTENQEMLNSLKIGYLQLSDWQENVGETIGSFDFSTIGPSDISEVSRDADSEQNLTQSDTGQKGDMGKWREIKFNETEALRQELIDSGYWD